MALTRVDSDLFVHGNIAGQSMSIPAGTLTNAGVNAAAAIEATKLVHAKSVTTDFGVAADAAPSADVKKVLFRATGACTISFVKAALIDCGSSTDVKFDLLKASAGSDTPATVLSATIDFTHADTDNTVKTGTLASAALVAGDVLVGHMDYTSATGAKGPSLTIEIYEGAN